MKFLTIYVRTFGDVDIGVTLFQYNIDGKDYTIMKRSTMRSIFVQILLFGANGIYTILVDKNMDMMMFATGNIYRETGTSSSKLKDKGFTELVRREAGNVMV